MQTITSAQASDQLSPAELAAANARVAKTLVEPELRQTMISEAAYFRAQHRGFQPGHELDDWLVAEAEVDTLLMNCRLK